MEVLISKMGVVSTLSFPTKKELCSFLCNVLFELLNFSSKKGRFYYVSLKTIKIINAIKNQDNKIVLSQR